jgi:hypothetical protein
VANDTTAVRRSRVTLRTRPHAATLRVVSKSLISQFRHLNPSAAPVALRRQATKRLCHATRVALIAWCNGQPVGRRARFLVAVLWMRARKLALGPWWRRQLAAAGVRTALPRERARLRHHRVRAKRRRRDHKQITLGQRLALIARNQRRNCHRQQPLHRPHRYQKRLWRLQRRLPRW